MEHTCKHFFILKQVFNGVFSWLLALWFHVVQGVHIYTSLCNNSAFSGIECPLVSVFITSKIFFLKNASLNKTKNGFGVGFLLSMQLISHLLSRWALDLQLADSVYIRICVKSFGSVCPVSTVSVVQLNASQGILNNLPEDCVVCVSKGVAAVMMRLFLYSVAAPMHFFPFPWFSCCCLLLPYSVVLS